MGTPTSYEQFIRNSSALATRSEWLVELYIKDPDGVEVIIRLSLRGTNTGLEDIVIGDDTLPANTRYSKRILEPPSITQSLWKPGSIFGSSLPSFGRLLLNNRDGGLDQYKPSNGYQWKDCLVKVFFADLLHVADTINKEFEALLGDPEYSLSDVVVPIRGLESRFEQTTSERVYRGTNLQKEFSGTRLATFGSTPAKLNITGNLTVKGWIWVDTGPSANFILVGWSGGTARPWFIVLSTSTLKLVVAAIVGGGTELATASLGLTLKKPYHVAIVINGRDAIFHIWDEDLQTLTSETFTNAFSNATRDSTAGSPTYVMQSASGGVIWLDDWYVLDVAQTASEIAADRHRPQTTASLPSSVKHYLPFDEGSGTTITDLSASPVNGSLSGAGSSTWLPSLEGTAELAGVPKPDMWGEGKVDPILVAPVQYIYQVAGAGGIQAITSEEGGLAHTMNATAANLRTFLTTNPAAGNAGTYLARGYFRLSTSSVPTLPVTATVQGYNDGPLGYVNKPTTIIRDVITRRGPKLADPGDIATATFTSAASAFNPTVGFYLKTPIQIMAFLDKIARSGADVWGYRGSGVQFRVDHFEGPKVTADHNFTGKHIVLNSFRDQSPQQIIYKVIVKYLERPKTLAENEVSATVKGTANWIQWTKQWQEQPATDEDLLADYDSLGPPLVIETGIVSQEDAKDLAEYVLSIVKGPKSSAMVSMIAAGRPVIIGDTETVMLTLQGGEIRLGVDGETNYLVLTTELSPFRGQVRHEIWGSIEDV